jgi:MFS transporter, SP family, solute carrier family 2 (myo-inositol transporter), member 13
MSPDASNQSAKKNGCPMQGRQEAAERAVRTLFPPSVHASITSSIQQEIDSERSAEPLPVTRLLTDALARSQLHIGVMLQVLQQLCGINTVMYFTPAILQMAGFTDPRQALLWACLPACCNAVGTVAGVLSILTLKHAQHPVQ